nr:MAG TPA: hypothetical protein [Caudoviricetes sp.]
MSYSHRDLVCGAIWIISILHMYSVTSTSNVNLLRCLWRLHLRNVSLCIYLYR